MIYECLVVLMLTCPLLSALLLAYLAQHHYTHAASPLSKYVLLPPPLPLLCFPHVIHSSFLTSHFSFLTPYYSFSFSFTLPSFMIISIISIHPNDISLYNSFHLHDRYANQDPIILVWSRGEERGGERRKERGERRGEARR